MATKGKNASVGSFDDNRIIELFFARSEDAVPALSSKYGAGCMNIAQKVLNNKLDAEECVNDAYLRIWHDIPPKRPNPLAAYVFRIVRNLSINRLERNTAKKRAGGVYLCLDELKDCVPTLQSVEDTAARGTATNTRCWPAASPRRHTPSADSLIICIGSSP